MAGGQRPGSLRGTERTFRQLARLGCGPDALRLLAAHLGASCPTGEAWARELDRIAEFAAAIGSPAAHDFFRAITETADVARLTDPRVLAFARAVDRHTAEWYFWAIWGTGAVGALTDDGVLGSVDVFRAIDSSATVEYFLAVRETKQAARLALPRVLDFARSIGSEASVEMFGACWETGAVDRLTDERVLESVGRLGPEAAKELFRAVRATRAVAELTDPRVLGALAPLGPRAAREFFRAVRETRAVRELTGDDVLLFAELVGRGPAEEYFRTVGSTKAVDRLTAPRVLRASGVVRSIGPDAALDYFLAIASAETPSRSEPGADAARDVPVLTLLDLPSYRRYQPLGLAGATAAFWSGLWAAGGGPSLPFHGAGGWPLAVGAWAGVLLGTFLLVDALARHATERFLGRRRRLLNEHGIRWHDCQPSAVTCPTCWGPDRIHAVSRYDDPRCCRCPAC